MNAASVSAIPFHRGDVVSFLYEKGEVLSRQDTPAGVRLEVALPAVWAARAAAFLEGVRRGSGS
ncbi:MAG: hypothetical protein K6U04_10580 [Armatimonadetes bacterium]|nr:hypothetical protein [Armatimonadota bacterium]